MLSCLISFKFYQILNWVWFFGAIFSKGKSIFLKEVVERANLRDFGK